MTSYSRSELYRLMGKYSWKGLKEDVCNVIKNYGIKRKFRGTKGRMIRSRKRNLDNNRGVHTSLLKELKKIPLHYDKMNRLGLAICNSRSLRKIKDLITDCSLNKIDVFFIVESWVNSEDDIIELSVIKDFGYKIDVVDRKKRSGGGVSLIYRSNIEVSCVEKGEYESFEYALWRMQLGNKQLIVLGMYRPPYSKTHPVTFAKLLGEFPEIYSTWKAQYKEILVIGDFNIDTLNSDSWESRPYGDFIDAFRLVQVVREPTHESGSCIDHILYNQGSTISVSEVKQGWKISEHYVMCTDLNFDKPKIDRKVVKSRKLHLINQDMFSKDLQSMVDRSYNVVESNLVDYYNAELVRLMDIHAPLVEKTITKRNRSKWFNEESLELKRGVRRQERRYRCSGEKNDKEVFKKCNENI